MATGTITNEVSMDFCRNSEVIPCEDIVDSWKLRSRQPLDGLELEGGSE